jgi:hypothetical protein
MSKSLSKAAIATNKTKLPPLFPNIELRIVGSLAQITEFKSWFPPFSFKRESQTNPSSVHAGLHVVYLEIEVPTSDGAQ